MAEKEKKQLPKSLLNRLEWTETTLHAILHGGKPVVDPRNPEQSWLLEQMTRMYKAGFLCEEPISYIMLPGEKPDEVRHYKGITVREPLPKNLTSESKYLRDFSQKRGINNYKILGLDDAYRYRRDAIEQADDAGSFILTRGGTMELYQWVRFLRAQAEGLVDVNDKPFVVLNVDDYWSPALKALDGVYQNVGANFVTDTRHDTVEVLDALLSDVNKGLLPVAGDESEVLSPGSTVFLVTGNRKKVNDYKKVFRRRGTAVDCHWFQQKFDKPEGADEFSYSYVGNLVEKINKFYYHIRDYYGPEGFRKAMAEKDFDIGKSVLWFDDSGLELEENLTGGPEFGNCTYRMNPYKKHGPGAEMKNAINAMQNHPFEGERAMRGMIKRFEAAATRLRAERIEAGETDPQVSHDAFDRNCVAIVPISDFVDAIEQGASFGEVIDKVPMHFFQSCTAHELIFAPRPDVRAVDSKNFLVPKQDPDGRTQAENPHYVAQHSITTQVVKAAARVLGFEKHESESRALTNVFNRESGQEWRIGTQQTIHKGAKVHGIGKKALGGLKGLFRLMAGNGGRYDLSMPRDHHLLLENKGRDVLPNALNNFYDFTRRADGFLLTPDTRRTAGDDMFWHRAFFFFSLIVGRQINDKSVTSKPLLVMDTPTWKPFVGLLETYGGGLIPEMPHEIIDAVVEKHGDLRKSLSKAFSEYQPDELPEYIFREDGKKCPEGLFRVTVYCSASTTDYPLKMWSRDFAFDCGALGFALKNGGGTGPDGLMIETSEGIRLVRNQFDEYLRAQGLSGAPQTHISSIQCVDTAQEEGLCKFNDHWAVYPTIYQRMHVLQDTDAEVVLPGGAGTFQEIAASVLMRKAGIYPTENRPLVIVNHEGIYDPFLKLVPEKDFRRYNIKVVNTAEEAMRLLVEARKNRNMEPLLPYSMDELESYKKGFMRDLRKKDASSGLQNHLRP